MEVDKLEGVLKRISEYQQYITRATSQKEKFPLSVVQKVILNYELRIEVEKEKGAPIIAMLQERVGWIHGELERLLAQSSQAEELQELELLYTIGAISQDDFQKQKQEIEKSLDMSSQESLTNELQWLENYLQQWQELTGETESISMAPESTPFLAEAVAEEPSSPPPLPTRDIPPLQEEEDFSALVEEDSLLSEEPLISSEELVVEEDYPAEQPFMVDDSEPVLGDTFLQEEFPDDGFDALGEELPLELEDEPAPEMDAAHQAFEDVPAFEDAPISNEIRSAILLKNEGTPQEELYTFSGEQYSIGRHQENNIQIRGDSKVSRYHCKLFRRNGHFYIEDQHSSNGTLVNGELISERRLYGGEELKIGETIFRFRLQ